MSENQHKPVATYTASLLNSFRQVPPAAVPAMFDCVLASTDLSPSLIYSTILEALPNLTKDVVRESEALDSEQLYIRSFVVSLCHLLKKLGPDSGALQSFIWKILVPLTELVHVHECKILNETADSFFDVVVETNSWGIVEATMVPFFIRSVGLSMGLLQNEDMDIYVWSSCSFFCSNGSNKIDSDMKKDAIISGSESFPLYTVCHILTSILEAAVRSQGIGGMSKSTATSGTLVENLLWDLCNMTVRMLSQSVEHRSCAIKLLLPVIFRVFVSHSAFKMSFRGETYTFSRKQFLKKVWTCCRTLFSLGSMERRDSYNILSLYVSSISATGGHEDDDSRDKEGFDIKAEKEFWNEMKKGLVDKENLVRKQSLQILKKLLHIEDGSRAYSGLPETISSSKSSMADALTKRGQWAVKEANSMGVGHVYGSLGPSLSIKQKWGSFFLLYEMLEEYGTHLVEAAWSHQISILLHSSFPEEDYMQSVNGLLNEQEIEASEDVFNWLSILWERGFEHDNPLVRCLIMESFLGIEWNNYKYCNQLVPEDFVLGPFLQGLNDPVHHKDFGMKGIYHSRTIDGATIFIRQYVCSLPSRNRLAFLINLASSSKRLSFGRAGLMSLAECIASAACVISKNYVEGNAYPSLERVQVPCIEENSLHKDKAELLDILRFTLESSKQHFNPKYRLQVCDRILDAAASVLDGTDVPLEILLNFISVVPREYTDCGGSLRVKIQEWISTGDDECCNMDCSGKMAMLLKELYNFPGCFISLHQSASRDMNYDDDDLDAWDSEARRWARVLFLVVKKNDHLDHLLTFIQTHFTGLFIQNNDDEAVHVKFLILVLSFIKELQIMHERVIGTAKTGSSKLEISLVKINKNLSSTEIRAVIDKFTKLYGYVLERLLSFATSCCSIFWSGLVEHTDLSGSIRGKLGGPSQRRLSPSTKTGVLRAIISVKAVAYISSWSVQYGGDDFVKLAFNFLWDFFWKINLLQNCESETVAEIWLAAYEALVHVLKVLTSGFSALALDTIMKDRKPSSLIEGKALLDSLVVPFLRKINSLIAVEKLTRSRRAILMNLKWMCVEYLMSLPSNAVQKGISLDDGNSFFSDAALRCILADLIDSLENAGEGSVLPMLRSIRLILELFDSQKTDISSFDGMDVQMMWSLVRASWIVHVNCNKRRVAPLAALLSSVLHYSLFSKESMHEFDNEPGPVKWFIEKLLEEGTKSPRTIRLAALHLTGLWISYPKTIKHYMKELKLLTLYGSVAFDEDFEGELAENYDARREVSLLAKSPDTELTAAFINTELYARVSVAVLFHKLADTANIIGTVGENENCRAALQSGKVFLQELLDFATNDKDLVKELYKKYSGVHRRKIRVWQMICILAPFVDEDLLVEVTCRLHTSLNRNNLPGVRQYLETFAINIYLRFPSLVTEQLVPIFRDYDMRSQALASYVFIAANVILHAPASRQANHLGELFPPIVPLLTSHHHSLRGFTQLLVYQVLCKLLPSLDSSLYETTALEKRCLEDLRSYLANNSDCTRLRASMEGYLDAFNPEDSITPAGIFSNRVEELEFECAPTSLMDQVTAFLNEVREDLRSSMARDAQTIKNESLRINEEQASTVISKNPDKKDLQAQLPKDLLFDFQKKITISKCQTQNEKSDILGKTDSYKTLMEIEKEDQLLDELLHSKAVAADKIRRNRQHFILVASLIDRIPNLAGLARTCEVFKAAGMVVADANIVHDKQFQLISVTAEKWVPITEVPVCNLIVFLQKKKREGYSILGLEQTANSIPLDEYVFPKKTILVLGREKEGIPVEIIHILDACIEIPQLGVVRSLNVHVSGAIALWEYTRQQRSQ